MPEPPEAYDEAILASMIDRYQRLAARLALAGPGDDQEVVRAAIRSQLEALWPLLEAVVRPVAWGWVRSCLADLGGSRGARDALEGVTTSMCMHILDSLAGRPVAATPPIGPLLRRIAQHRMVDEQRYNKRHSPDQPAPAGAAAGAPRLLPLSIDDDALHDHPLLHLDLPLQLDDRLYREECLAAISRYWELRLSDDEHRIIASRLTDPPTPYDLIAAAFAPPWSSDAVRKRYSRIMADTRAHLRALDLLPSDADHQ